MWEYRIERIRVEATYYGDNIIVKDRLRLGKLGRHGWEAISTEMTPTGDILVMLKRPMHWKHLDSHCTVKDALVSQGIMENSL